MAKKKNEGDRPVSPHTEDLTGEIAGALPDGLTGGYPTEGLSGPPSGLTGDLGMPTEGFTGALGMPTEGFTGQHALPTEGFTGQHSMPTEGFSGGAGRSGMTGDHGMVPTEGFGSGTGATGRTELDELDDVLVLLPEEDDAPATSYTGEVIRTESMGSGMRATTEVPRTESPTSIEDVALLSQHPDEGYLPVDALPDVQVLEELPDIEDVEDITSLVEDAVAHDMGAPMVDFEDEYMPPERGNRRKGNGFGVFLRVAAAAALLVTGVMYGPELYDRYLEKDRTALATGNGENPGSTAGTTVPTDPTSTGVGVVATQAGDPVRFRTWVDGVLAANFGADVPSER